MFSRKSRWVCIFWIPVLVFSFVNFLLKEKWEIRAFLTDECFFWGFLFRRNRWWFAQPPPSTPPMKWDFSGSKPGRRELSGQFITAIKKEKHIVQHKLGKQYVVSWPDCLLSCPMTFIQIWNYFFVLTIELLCTNCSDCRLFECTRLTCRLLTRLPQYLLAN